MLSSINQTRKDRPHFVSHEGLLLKRNKDFLLTFEKLQIYDDKQQFKREKIVDQNTAFTAFAAANY